MSLAHDSHNAPNEHSAGLSLIHGERGADRYTATDLIIAKNAWTFLEAGRLSVHFAMHFGVFRLALTEVKFNKDEREHYQRWIDEAANKRKIYQHALQSPVLTPRQLERLEALDDPCIHIMDVLETLRVGDYPDLGREAVDLARVKEAYSLVLRSVHSPIPVQE